MPQRRRKPFRRSPPASERLGFEMFEERIALNAAPVMMGYPFPPPSLDPVPQYPTTPFGQSGTAIARLVDADGPQSNFFDADGDAPGMAITGVGETVQAVWISHDDGASWTNAGLPTEAAAIVIAADPANRVFLQTKQGTPDSATARLTFKLWDRTGGHQSGDQGINTVYQPISETDHGASALAIPPSGNYLFAGSGNFGPSLTIFDLSQSLSNPPLSETPLGNTESPSFNPVTAIALAPTGSIAFVAQSREGVHVIDYANPALPTITKTFSQAPGDSWSDSVNDVTLSTDGQYAYVVQNGLKIYDVSSPSSPLFRGSVALPQRGYKVAVSPTSQFVYVADHDSGLHIIDVSNPSLPRISSTVPIDDLWYALDVASSGDGQTVYVGSTTSYSQSRGKIQAIDVNTPASPIVLDVFPVPDNEARVLTLSQDSNTLYVSGDKTTYVLDVSSPNSLSLQGSTGPTRHGDIALSTDGEMLYAVATEEGLALLPKRSATPFSFGEWTVHATLISKPTIASIAGLGAEIYEGEPLLLTVRGSNFTSSTTVTVSGPGTLLNSYEVVDGSTITLSVTHTRSSSDNPHVVTVTNVDGQEDQRSYTVGTVLEPPPLLQMFIHENEDGGGIASYRIPAFGSDGTPLQGRSGRITASSSNPSILPTPITSYGAPNIPSSVSISPMAGKHGTVTVFLHVEDGGSDNDIATTSDNGYATHRIAVTVLEIISTAGTAVLSKDASEQIYADTMPITYEEKPASASIGGFAVIGAESDNTLLVTRHDSANRLVADQQWSIASLFDSLRSVAPTVLDLDSRGLSRIAYVTAENETFIVGGLIAPTLTVRRGQTYTFDLNIPPGHSFYLQTSGNGFRADSGYAEGFAGNGQSQGRFDWIVSEDAPSQLFYQDRLFPEMFGEIFVID